MKTRFVVVAFFMVALSGWGANTLIHCVIKPIDRAKIHLNETTYSSNWSGYVAAPSLQTPAPNSVSYVQGSWIVPTLGPTNDNSYTAIWVGIDGFLDTTVEQIGTMHNWISGVQQNIAWFEMYPNGAYQIVGFPVNIGDQISAKIGYKGNDVFKLVLTNITQGVYTTIPSQYTTMKNAQRSSAEWIVEAPYSRMVLPLADFKLVTFNYCDAIINGIKGFIQNDNWVNDPIEMISQTDVKSVPSVLLKNGTCFQVIWEHE